MRAWGDDTLGQLGDDQTGVLVPPTAVCAPGATAPCTTLFAGPVAVGTGSFHTIALMPDGTLFEWGNNDSGQLGDGTADPLRLTPGPVAPH